MSKRVSLAPIGARSMVASLIPLVLCGALLYFAALKITPIITIDGRSARIKQIYASLNLDMTYLPESSNIFGDKRPYPNSPGHTYASSVAFVRGDTVDHTVSDVTKHVEAAGFHFLEQANAGSASRQYYFESARGEYIRIAVSSKPRDDAIRNALLMGLSPVSAETTLDQNAGPSDVIIKVNLDDNSD